MISSLCCQRGHTIWSIKNACICWNQARKSWLLSSYTLKLRRYNRKKRTDRNWENRNLRRKKCKMRLLHLSLIIYHQCWRSRWRSTSQRNLSGEGHIWSSISKLSTLPRMLDLLWLLRLGKSLIFLSINKRSKKSFWRLNHLNLIRTRTCWTLMKTILWWRQTKHW
jgi:hypothetical protein